MTTMTRQHFNFIADTINSLDDTSTNQSLDAATGAIAKRHVAQVFARALAATNPGFKPKRFLRACGVED